MFDWLRVSGRRLGQLRGIFALALVGFTILHILTMHMISSPAGYFLSTGILLALALFFKFPLVASLALCVFGVIYNTHSYLDGLSYVGTYVPVAYFVVRRENRKAALYAAIQAIAASLSAAFDNALWVAIGTFVFLIFSWTIGITLRVYDDRVRIEGERADQATAAARLEAAEFAKEIAREMHDAVAHSMSSVVLKSRAAALRPELPEESRKELEEITDLTIQALGEMRSLLRLLRSGDSESGGRYRNYLVVDLQREARRIEDFLTDQGYDVRMVVEGEFEGSDPLAISTFVSCIREASANVIRHGADDKPVIITITADDEHISLAFINTIDHERHSIFPSSGLGLIGIRERVEAIGGTCTSQEVSERWLLTFSVPKHIGALAQGELLHVE